MASKLDRLQKKGFKVNEAALSKIARGDQEPGGEYSEININDIEENPDNALYRELDTEEDIALLADDIRRAGLLHNLVVFPKTGVGGKYVLLSGERRLRALRLLVEQDKREHQYDIRKLSAGYDDHGEKHQDWEGNEYHHHDKDQSHNNALPELLHQFLEIHLFYWIRSKPGQRVEI
jgi:hypothetical protein